MNLLKISWDFAEIYQPYLLAKCQYSLSMNMYFRPALSFDEMTINSQSFEMPLALFDNY